MECEFSKYHQQMYVGVVKKAAKHGHNEGLWMLLSMMRSKLPCSSTELKCLNYFRKQKKIEGSTVLCSWCQIAWGMHQGVHHMHGKESCPQYTQSLAWINTSYVSTWSTCFIPPLENGESKIQVHSDVFHDLFHITWDTYLRLNKLWMTGLPPQQLFPDKWVHNGGHNKLSEDKVHTLLAILIQFPHESSQYAPQNEDSSRKYYYSLNLSLYHFWCDYLENPADSNDYAFLQQCEWMTFYPSFMKITARSLSDKQYHSDVTWKKQSPSISYSAACNFYKDYDIKSKKENVIFRHSAMNLIH